MEGLEKEYEDTMHQLFLEQCKNPRNEPLIIKLKMTHMEQIDMLAELSLGTPIMSGLKAKFDVYKNGENPSGADDYFNELNPFYSRSKYNNNDPSC